MLSFGQRGPKRGALSEPINLLEFNFLLIKSRTMQWGGGLNGNIGREEEEEGELWSDQFIEL